MRSFVSLDDSRAIGAKHDPTAYIHMRRRATDAHE